MLLCTSSAAYCRRSGGSVFGGSPHASCSSFLLFHVDSPCLSSCHVRLHDSSWGGEQATVLSSFSPASNNNTRRRRRQASPPGRRATAVVFPPALTQCTACVEGTGGRETPLSFSFDRGRTHRVSSPPGSHQTLDCMACRRSSTSSQTSVCSWYRVR